MFDTHCHLNFSAFKNNLKEVINNAKAVGVDQIVIPGTDFESSKRAVEIAGKYEGIYAAIGIHPHHVYELHQKARYSKKISSLLPLLKSKKVVAIGEIGVDRHIYQKTKYKEYGVDEVFIEYQKAFLRAQIDLAIQYKKSIIFHNRDAKNDLLTVIREKWNKKLEERMVFHCCEADEELLDFAKNHKVFIGVDGDITYDRKKQEFIKKIPLDLLVLETDSPFLKPIGIKFPNEPKNLKIIVECIAQLTTTPTNRLIEATIKNAKRLFQLKKEK